MNSYSYSVADVFTKNRLEGNPVAVFNDARGLSSENMQSIANEMHLSETVFVFPAEADGHVRVRIFTPVNELPFAGHPTLGTAIVLSEMIKEDCIRMETGMRIIPFSISRDIDGTGLSASMRQPIPTWKGYDRESDLMHALNIMESTLPILVYHNGPRHVFVGLDSISALSALVPDQRALASLPDVAINCFAGSGSHWRMRMFSPAYGVVEDAATGSAAGPLAVHLASHNLAHFNESIEILQGVEIGRPSYMYAKVTANEKKIDTIEVSGSAVVVAKGNLYV